MRNRFTLFTTLALWLFFAGLSLTPIHAQTPITNLAWRPDGKIIALGGPGGIWLVDDTGQPGGIIAESNTDTGGVSALAWSEDGTFLVEGRYDGVIRIWNTVTGDRLVTLRGHIGAVNSVAISLPDGLIASAGDDLTVRLWAVKDGKPLFVLKRHKTPVMAAAFGLSPWLISGGMDAQVLRWDTDGKARPSPQGHTGTVLAITFNPDKTLYATASVDHTVRLWRMETGESLGVFNGHSDQVIALGWRGNTLLSAGWDGAIRAWDTTTGQQVGEPIAIPARVRAAAFSPDGRKIAVVASEGGEKGILRILDTR